MGKFKFIDTICPCGSTKKYINCCISMPYNLVLYAKKHRERVDGEYKRFTENLDKNLCYLCSFDFGFFSETSPCIHWLLRPVGFKKKYLYLVYEKYGYFQIQSYLRWLANSESPLKNINDLRDEMDEKKIIENTIKYKNYEWSFSCSEGDFKGHEGTYQGFMPHYHLQMKIDGKPFITFSDFHLPFNKNDFFYFDLQQGRIKNAKHSFGRGMGLQDFAESMDPNTFLKNLDPADTTDGIVKIQTLIEARDGDVISDEQLRELYKRSKETNTLMANLLQQFPRMDIKSVFIPGPTIPAMGKRKKRR